MILKKIELKNFRNYDKTIIDFDKKINIFTGDNAQGKTNILESIYVLALTKSYRVLVDKNLIKNGNNVCRIKGLINRDGITTNLDIKIGIKEKEVKINNKKIMRLMDYISNLKVIMFCPDNLDIVKGSPGIRRNYLNIELAQISVKYLKILNEYNKILRIRNEYLKIMNNNNIKDKTYYEIVTNNLIERAIKIYLLRKDFVNQINKKIGKIYKNITGQTGIYIQYDSFIDEETANEEQIKNILKAKLTNLFVKEKQQGITLVGPHRDDFSFILNGEDLKIYGSQGQQRIAILALKIAEIGIFKDMTSEYPILLLDDVFSELDKRKVNNILKHINKRIQIIITTTDINLLKDKIVAQAKIFNIKNGLIRVKQEVKKNDK